MKNLIKRFLPASALNIMRKLRRPYLLDWRYADRLRRYEQFDGMYESGTMQLHGATVRRLAHNVEKGLNRSDFEPGHSCRVYDQVKAILSKYDEDDGTGDWARSLLRDYESAQVDVGVLDEKYRRKYQRNADHLDSSRLLSFLRLRRSCREYQDKLVLESDINLIVEAALEAPSSCSRQALKVFCSLTEKKTKAVLECFTGFTCFSENVPAAMVFCVDLRPYFLPKELFVPTLDVGLAASNAALMATSLDLSMTYLSWGARRQEQEERLRRLMGIPEYCEIVVGATCGYPAYVPHRPERKHVSSALTIVS